MMVQPLRRLGVQIVGVVGRLAEQFVGPGGSWARPACPAGTTPCRAMVRGGLSPRGGSGNLIGFGGEIWAYRLPGCTP